VIFAPAVIDSVNHRGWENPLFPGITHAMMPNPNMPIKPILDRRRRFDTVAGVRCDILEQDLSRLRNSLSPIN
jgi:hypothetical protein